MTPFWIQVIISLFYSEIQPSSQMLNSMRNQDSWTGCYKMLMRYISNNAVSTYNSADKAFLKYISRRLAPHQNNANNTRSKILLQKKVGPIGKRKERFCYYIVLHHVYTPYI